MPAERKTCAEVLSLVRSSRAQLEAALARIPEERIEDPLLDGDWSGKDLMAHITHWEMAFLSNLGEPPPPVSDQGDENATNRAVYEYHRARPLADIRREFEETHRRLVERVSQLDDDGLNVQPVPNNDRVVWQYVAGETWEHYPAHTAQLGQAGS
jgi:uncharacterized damage-inducible protein DinB